MLSVTVRRSTIVKPSSPTPHRRLWNSNLDLVVPRYHTPSVYFYRPPDNGVRPPDFFSGERLRAALAAALVEFYPLAGRLARDEKGRIEVECGGQGAVFMEAESEAAVEDFGDFAPTMEMRKLIPAVGCSDDDLRAFPLLVLQITHFKCGGVSLGVGICHHIVDGSSGIHFINSWSDIARGLNIGVPPIIDRTLVRARDRPTPSFPHIEYYPSPHLKASPLLGPTAPTLVTSPTIKIFKFTREQLNVLKKKGALGSTQGSTNYSSYILIAAHIWQCACIARGLDANQLTKLSIAIDGRGRLRPSLPQGYLGNVIFAATPIAKAGEITAEGRGLVPVAATIQAALSRMDDEYLRSALDYLEVQPDLTALWRGAHTFRCPNLGVTSWARLPIYDADFGWGRPVFMGPGGISFEGLAFVLPSPTGDGGVSVAISLQAEHMVKFDKLVHDV